MASDLDLGTLSDYPAAAVGCRPLGACLTDSWDLYHLNPLNLVYFLRSRRNGIE